MKQNASKTAPTIFTIGHSNHPLETFLALLEQHGLGLVVDVRSRPYSAYASDFNRGAIRRHLQKQGVEYLFLGHLLGGQPEAEQFYDETGHVRYDRLARSPEFQQGINQLLDGIATRRAALLCGEEDPTGCHRRRLIGRVLAERGWTVVHIRGDGRLQSEEEVAKEEWLQKTKGQMTLFDLEEAEPWRSTRSVSPRRPQPNSSSASDERESSV
jgi:uncharacterized protein (DUF488 family)